MKINNLVYPIMIVSTIMGLIVYPYLWFNGTLSVENLQEIFTPFEIAWIRIGLTISVYGSFIGSWLYWYKFTRKK